MTSLNMCMKNYKNCDRDAIDQQNFIETIAFNARQDPKGFVVSFLVHVVHVPIKFCYKIAQLLNIFQ